jgi:hypothetical protein
MPASCPTRMALKKKKKKRAGENLADHNIIKNIERMRMRDKPAKSHRVAQLDRYRLYAWWKKNWRLA